MTTFTLRPRLRDRLFPVLTALLAGACYVGAQQTADYVGTMNSARVLGALMAGSAMDQPAQMPSLTRRLFPGASAPLPPPNREAEAARQARLGELKRQVGTVEVVIHVWRRVMWGVAAWMGLTALVAALTWRVRLFHLLGAVVILLSTATTLVGMWFLVRPDYGGMPPLPIRSHVYVALVQSAYAWILLVAFSRRLRAPAIAG